MYHCVTKILNKIILTLPCSVYIQLSNIKIKKLKIIISDLESIIVLDICSYTLHLFPIPGF